VPRVIRQMMGADNFFRLMVFSIVVATTSVFYVPFSVPLPSYIQMATTLLAGMVTTDHMPAGYALFLALLIKIGGMPAVFAGQAAVFVSISLLTYVFLKQSGASEKTAALAALFPAIHPLLFVNVKRISDMSLFVFVVLSLLCVLVVARKKPRVGLSLAAGILFGSAVLTRSAFLFGLPAILWGLSCPIRGIVRRSLHALIFLSVAAVVLYGGNYALKRNWEPISKYYGAYNMYIGANPRSAGEFIRNYQAEGSVGPALADAGIPMLSHGEDNVRMERIYREQAWQFIRFSPWEYTRLVLIKLYTLFRPDYRRVGSSDAVGMLKFTLQTLIACPIVFWACIRLRLAGRARGDVFLLSILALYLLPHLLTVADPRYRLPMDVLLILDASLCLGQRRGVDS